MREILSPAAVFALIFLLSHGAPVAQDKFVPLYMGVPFIPLKTDEFNETVSSSGGQWTHDPVTVSLRFTGPFEGTEQKIQRTNQSAESPTVTRVTVTKEGLLDDSLEGEKYFLLLEKTKAGTWQIRSAGKLVKCKETRGKTEYSNTPCR